MPKVTTMITAAITAVGRSRAKRIRSMANKPSLLCLRVAPSP
jgi:hypothetical protein